MPAQSPFKATVGLVAVGHALLIGLLLVAGANSCMHRKKPPEVLPVEIMVAVDDGPEVKELVKPVDTPPPPPPKPPEPEPPPPPPEPDPEPPPALVKEDPKPVPPKPTPPKPTPPKPEPPKPTPPKPTPPKPTPPKPTPPKEEKVKTSDTPKIVKGTRITAPNRNPPPPNMKKLSPEEIARRLALNATPGNRNLTPEGEAFFFEVIRRRLYKAWTQPGSVPRQLTAEVEIRMNPSGTILSRRMLRSSGNATMDQSVMEAVQSVLNIDGLTADFIESKNGRVTIIFELSMGSA